ncbi:MAG: FHA domain-containing protein, partial [Chloroflexota bacterium]
MIEIWITQGSRELYRQVLTDGQFVLGRGQDNEITIKNPNISRHHLQLEISGDQITVMDLGSTNGTRVDGRPLRPNQAASWKPDQQIQIGDLVLYARQDSGNGQHDGQSPSQPEELAGTASGARPDNMLFAAVSANAHPPLTFLSRQPVLAGSAAGCAIRLQAANVAPHHCSILVRDDAVQVTNLAQGQPTLLSGQNLAMGETANWSVGTPLMLGGATLNLTLQPADAKTNEYAIAGRDVGASRPAWRRPVLLLPFAGLLIVCLLLTALLVVQGARCETLSASCLFSFSGSDAGGPVLPVAQGRATPTLAPFSTRRATPTSVPTVEL